MKYTKSTLTIGIPAYNEEANIGLLLNDITLQKNRNYILKEIIVVSDGSTDSTVKKVEQASIQSIKLIINKKRTGLANVQNLDLILRGQHCRNFPTEPCAPSFEHV